MSDPTAARVFLVGAGPGSPGLLTLRAAEVLAKADVVLYDQLVPRRLLDLANPAAELICVRELPGTHPDKYPHIHALLTERATPGKIIVRLKGGDPLVFGRGGEEADTLRAAGIPYEIVPGVTAALAAAAYLEIPLTHRHHASAVALVTGHELPNKPGNKLDWKALAAFPGTLAIYMGIARLPLIVAELLKYGKDSQTPAAVVERVSTGDMRTVTSTLVGLEQARRHAGLESPGLILIGDTVTLRDGPSWFQERPLFGQRVIITRPRHQAEAFTRRLEELGAVPYLIPAVEIRPPSDLVAVDAAIQQLQQGEWDWLAFTSANGVQSFLKRIRATGRDLRILGGVKLAAVGPATAAALAEYHLDADVVPVANFSAEGLVAALATLVVGQRVLIARPSRGKETLREGLAARATVGTVTVYEQVDALEPAAEAFDALRRGEIRFLTLTSANVARAVLGLCDETIRGRIQRAEIRVVTISEDVARAVREAGLPVAGVAETASTEGMIRELIRLAGLTRPTDPHEM